MESVTSRQNAVVRTFRELGARRSRGDRRVLLEGAHLVCEALDAGVRLSVVALASRMLSRHLETDPGKTRELTERLEMHGARILSVSESVMAAISPVRSPPGIIAIAEFDPPALERAMEGPLPLVPVLAGVQDPGNLGAVVRTAEAAGATGLVACLPSADPFSWKAIRGSMGSTFRLPVPERGSMADALLAARRRGLAIVAAVPRGGTLLHAFDWRRPIAIMLGGEGAGLAEEHQDHADERITVPMKPPVESLNVAVSAAVMLYEAARQRATHRHKAD